MTDIPGFQVIDLEEHPIPIFEDCTVSVAEVFATNKCEDLSHNHELGYEKCLYLTLSGPEGASLALLVPSHSAFGAAILNGDLELLCKKVLDKVP